MFQAYLFRSLFLVIALCPIACASHPAVEEQQQTGNEANAVVTPSSDDVVGLAQKTAAFSWMMNYYKHPEPKSFRRKIGEFAKAGILDSPDYMMSTLGFVSRLFMDHDDMVPKWMDEAGKLTPRQQLVFIVSLRMSNTPTTNAILDDKVTDGNEASRIYSTIMNLDESQFFTPENLKKIPFENFNYDIVPFCWQAFFASGKEEYVRYIMQYATVRNPDASQDVSRLTARTSVLGFSEDHPLVKRIAEKYLDTLPAGSRERFFSNPSEDLQKAKLSLPPQPVQTHES